jgi:hypothetical protein
MSDVRAPSADEPQAKKVKTTHESGSELQSLLQFLKSERVV